jgi:hypothetical protein
MRNSYRILIRRSQETIDSVKGGVFVGQPREY